MKLHFWGAAQTVTGSMHLLTIDSAKGHGLSKGSGQTNILLDCGLYQGRRKHAFEINRNFPFDPAKIDALILSHAHIDHSGNIPTLVKQGFRGSIWATSATYDLATAMLQDSAHIQETDVSYVNKRRRRQGKRLFEPLYTQDDALAALEQFQIADYGHSFTPVPGVKVHFLDAGHILGSAITVIDIEAESGPHRLVFSGDIGRKNLPILRDPQIVDNAEAIIMESTYGNRDHAPPAETDRILKQVVASTYKRGGKVIIPAFAVGRTQEVVYALHQMTHRQELPPIDIYVDSPLAVNVTGIFRQHPECYDAEMMAFLQESDGHDPFGFSRLQYVRDVEHSKRLNFLKKPAIIISASGMCEAGRILHHLKNNIEDRRNTILFVGYQADHTLGRKILRGDAEVSIFGDHYQVKAQVVRVDGYSAHADRQGLLNWLAGGKSTPKQIFLVHGELESSQALAEQIKARGLPNVMIPDRGEVFEI